MADRVPFHTEPEPPPCEPVAVAPRVLRVTADNASMMTYHGTNTYLIESDAGIYVMDPGPASDQKHYDWLLNALNGRAAGIILTHHHSDHSGLAPQLREALGVPLFAYADYADDTVKPDVELHDGDRVGELQALHTPGHASDHLCFAFNGGVVFTGDHIMSWNSSIVSPPDGNMSDYCAQLRRMLDRNDALYLPGHGPPLPAPAAYTRQLLDHREKRERAILASVSTGPVNVEELSARLYRKSDPHLAWAARRNVEAHLAKLQQEGAVARDVSGNWALVRDS